MTKPTASTWLWVLLGAAVLLAPAILYGRPFVFYDTPAYWGWGRDLLEALQRPWPAAGQAWVPGRPFHGWEIGAHGATLGDLRFTLTLLTARSAFYALPFYLLVSSLGLWSVAVIQALAAAWVLAVVVRVVVPGAGLGVYLVILAILAIASSLGLEAGYAMPDLFGGLALLAAAVMIGFPGRFSWRDRLGLCAMMTYGVLAHAENGLNLASAAVLGMLVYRAVDATWPATLARIAPVAAAIVAGLGIAFAGGLLMKTAFGAAPRMAPFAASRLLADGTAQTYLRRACPKAPLAACDLATAAPVYPEYYLGIYPLDPPPTVVPKQPWRMYDAIQFRVVTDAEARHREQFVSEQSRLLFGALRADPVGLAKMAFRNGDIALINFATNQDFDSLRGLIREHTQRRDQIVAITPGGPGCAAGVIGDCGRFEVGALAPLQYLAVAASLSFLAACLWRGRTATRGQGVSRFSALVIGLVLINAVLCGALAGPYDRYQARVEWLIPFCALAALAGRKQMDLMNASKP